MSSKLRDDIKVHIIEAAGWARVEDGLRHVAPAWTAPPGRAPAGPWCIDSAWRWHVKGEVFRALAAKGWDVPEEYVGNARMCTVGEYPKHPTKSRGMFITLARALRIEGMQSLSEASKSMLRR